MKELNFTFCLTLPNLNLNSYIWLMATIMNRTALKKTKIHLFYSFRVALKREKSFSQYGRWMRQEDALSYS